MLDPNAILSQVKFRQNRNYRVCAGGDTEASNLLRLPKAGDGEEALEERGDEWAE